MALESGSFVNDLIITNPTGGDPRSELDDHLRLVKTTLRNTFPEGSAAIYGLRSGTATATTSGTSVSFTGIPSWVTRITMLISGMSTTSTSLIGVQLGDSGGFETNAYTGGTTQTVNAAATVGSNSATSHLLVTSAAAASTIHGRVTIELLNASTNTWIITSVIGFSNTASTAYGSTTKSTSAALDRVQIATDGVATFDAGSVNILYE